MADHTERSMDVTNAGRGIWLVKVPKFMREKWSENSGDAEVGKLKISKYADRKSPVISFHVNENIANTHKLPKEHKFISHDIKQSLGVFSLTKGPDTGEQSLTQDNGVVSLEGQVIQKFECQPVMDSNYLALKIASRKAAATPLRQAIAMDKPANVYKPRANHAYKIAQEKQKEHQGKKSREDKDKVLEMLFSAFEKHQYYNIRDLQKVTNQPITYLKEILKEVCDYNVKNPHKNTWELKREYMHYKGDVNKEESD